MDSISDAYHEAKREVLKDSQMDPKFKQWLLRILKDEYKRRKSGK